MLIGSRHSKRRLLVVICVILVLGVSCGTASSGDLTLFAQGGSIDYVGHAWSPNGHWLASESNDTSAISLFSANGQRANEMKLECDLGNGEGDFSWLPDGRLSCFISTEPPLVSIVALNARGHVEKSTTIPVPINSGTITFAMQWNPKHDWLATIAESQPGNGLTTLYLSNLQSQNLIQPMKVDSKNLIWSPDGTKLALVQQNGDIVLLQVQEAAPGHLTLTKIRQLIAGTPTDETIAWSPSSRWLVCRHGDYQGEDYLFLLATDGSGKTVKLTSSTTDGQLFDPAWSPDGQQLIVARAADGSLLSLNIAALLKAKGIEP